MCDTAEEVIERYLDVVDQLGTPEGGLIACSCLRTYAASDALADALYDLVGTHGEPPELGDLLVFDREVLAELGVDPDAAERLERDLNDLIGLLAGDLPDDDVWRTWRSEDAEHTLEVVAALAEAVCSNAPQADDADPLRRQRAKTVARYGIGIVGGIGVLALTGGSNAAAGVFVLTQLAQMLMELRS